MAKYTAHDTALTKFGYVQLVVEREGQKKSRHILTAHQRQRVVRYFHVMNKELNIQLPITQKELRRLYAPDDPMMTKVAAWIEAKLKLERQKPKTPFLLVDQDGNVELKWRSIQ